MSQNLAYKNRLLLFLGAHLLLWTLVPYWADKNLPLDVMECLSWGSQWQLGYDKHPLLAPWLAYSAAWLSDHQPWSLYLLSQLAVVGCFYAVWRLASQLVSPGRALLAVLLLEGCAYYNFITPDFNPNIIGLTTWAFTYLAFYQALQRNNYLSWVWVGLAAGLASLAKYSAIFLLVAMLLFMLINNHARRCLRTPPLYLGILTYILIMLPNGIWVVEHNFLPIHYALSRSSEGKKLIGHLWNPLSFFLAQLGSAALVIILSIPLWLKRTKSLQTVPVDHTERFNFQFVTALLWLPLALMLLLSLVTGMSLRSEWGTTLLSLVGIFIVLWLKPELDRRTWRLFLPLFLLTFVIALLAYPLANVITPKFKETGRRTLFPGQAIAQQLTQLWHKRYGTPLSYVAGSRWLTGNLAFYSKDRPAPFFNFSTQISSWINTRDLMQKGGIFIWRLDEGHGKSRDFQGIPEAIAKAYPHIQLQGILSYPWQTTYPLDKVEIAVAFLPPADTYAKLPERKTKAQGWLGDK